LAADPMNAVAEQHAHLVLALGQHDPDYVDAFYVVGEWGRSLLTIDTLSDGLKGPAFGLEWQNEFG
jgi:hypothetical protein